MNRILIILSVFIIFSLILMVYLMNAEKGSVGITITTKEGSKNISSTNNKSSLNETAIERYINEIEKDIRELE